MRYHVGVVAEMVMLTIKSFLAVSVLVVAAAAGVYMAAISAQSTFSAVPETVKQHGRSLAMAREPDRSW
jgi:methyl coenzyme M reductase subunit C